MVVVGLDTAGEQRRGASLVLPGRGMFSFAGHDREEAGEQADGGEEGTDLVDEFDAGGVGQAAEDSRADASHAKSEAEEETGDESDAAGNQFLGVDEDGGEGGGDDKADNDAEDAGPE